MPGEPLYLNWVMVPPGPGSGGHTTIFRIIRYLEAHGFKNRVYFYNIYDADHQYYESIIRDFYDFHGYVGKMDREMEDAHAVIATAWATAYPVLTLVAVASAFISYKIMSHIFIPSARSVSWPKIHIVWAFMQLQLEDGWLKS